MKLAMAERDDNLSLCLKSVCLDDGTELVKKNRPELDGRAQWYQRKDLNLHVLADTAT